MDVSAYTALDDSFGVLPMFLAASFVVFAIFFANVALGAFAGSAFIGDLGEMIVLFVASILFVVAILKAEADRKKKSGG